MSCIPANSSMSTVLTQVESQMDEASIERKGSRAYQIFPEANMDKDSDCASYSEELLYRRERLPSIVVEPSEHSELGNGKLWRPQNQVSNDVDKEDDSSTENTEISDGAEQQENIATEQTTVARKSSIGPSHGQLSSSRLTPPPSPTHPEAAPPCLQNTTSADDIRCV